MNVQINVWYQIRRTWLCGMFAEHQIIHIGNVCFCIFANTNLPIGFSMDGQNAYKARTDICVEESFVPEPFRVLFMKKRDFKHAHSLFVYPKLTRAGIINNPHRIHCSGVGD